VLLTERTASLFVASRLVVSFLVARIRAEPPSWCIALLGVSLSKAANETAAATRRAADEADAAADAAARTQ
jgi:hypothetical protein